MNCYSWGVKLEKAQFDDIFDIFNDENNRLYVASKISKSNKGTLFILDFIVTTINFSFTVYSSLHKSPKLALIFAATLLFLDIFPKVAVKMTMYNYLLKNKESKKFKLFGWTVEILFYIVLIASSVMIYMAMINKIVSFFSIPSMFLLYILGIIDKTVGLLLDKVKDVKGDETK